jgi:MoaA/NifB/PqqE/SkfB family radical SAM enzyme
MDTTSKIAHADFHISYRCNNRCAFCSESTNLGLYPEMEIPTEIIFRKLEELRARGIIEVLFTGGEPFLNPDLPRIVGKAVDLGLRVSVSTNGANVDLDIFNEIAMKLNQVIISYHAHTEQLHEAITGNREGFEKRKEFFEEAKKHVGRINFLANIVLTRLNLDAALDIVKDALSLNMFKLILLSNLAPEGRALEGYGELTPRLAEIAGIVGQVKDLLRNGNVELHVFGVPFCTLGPNGANSNDVFWYPRLTVERRPPEQGEISAELMESASWAPTRKRGKPQFCSECRCNSDAFCGGLFTVYADLFGCGELKPVGAKQ